MRTYSRIGIAGVTEPGKVVLAIAVRILREVQNIKRLSDDFKDEARGSLAIATTHTQARYVLPEPVTLLRRRYPKVAVTLHQGTPEQVAQVVHQVVEVVGLLGKQGVQGLLTDSIEVGAANWTPKMIEQESQAVVGYAAMLLESFVGVMALIAASVLIPGDYLAINVSSPNTAGLRSLQLGEHLTLAGWSGEHVFSSTVSLEALPFLADHGVATIIYYPRPLHLQKVYKDLGLREGDCDDGTPAVSPDEAEGGHEEDAREALREMDHNLEVTDITSFIAAIIQADQLGVSISKVAVRAPDLASSFGAPFTTKRPVLSRPR